MTFTPRTSATQTDTPKPYWMRPAQLAEEIKMDRRGTIKLLKSAHLIGVAFSGRKGLTPLAVFCGIGFYREHEHSGSECKHFHHYKTPRWLAYYQLLAKDPKTLNTLAAFNTACEFVNHLNYPSVSLGGKGIRLPDYINQLCNTEGAIRQLRYISDNIVTPAAASRLLTPAVAERLELFRPVLRSVLGNDY